MQMQQPQEFIDAFESLRILDSFVSDRNAQGVPITERERQQLDTVRKDVIHRIIQRRDTDTFREMDRFKHVELEYLYQVRGLRQVFPSAVFGEGYAGYGNSWTGSKIQLLYPQDHKRAGRFSRELVLPRYLIDGTTTLGEQLIPLRINIENDRHQLRDKLIWNAEDKSVPLEIFVENMLEDYGLPLSLTGQVVSNLQEQMAAFSPHLHYSNSKASQSKTDDDTNNDVFTDAMENIEQTTEQASELKRDTSPEIKPELKPETKSEPDSEEPKEKTPQSGPETVGADSISPSFNHSEMVTDPSPEADQESKQPQETSHENEVGLEQGVEQGVEQEQDRDEDMRITIKLDITIGEHTLIDQFEWDINCKENSPELFAENLTQELELPMEFAPAIVHSLREQSQAYTRALFRSGYQFDGRPTTDSFLQSQLSPPVGPYSFLRRPEMLALYSPALNQISAHAIESQEQERNRDSRSRRRMGRSRRYGASSTGAGVSTSELAPADDPAASIPMHDLSTPVYSALLPGGLDRNLDILRMTIRNSDDSEFSDLVYNFNRLRAQRGIPSASHYTPGLGEVMDRFIVKLRVAPEHLKKIQESQKKSQGKNEGKSKGKG